MLFASLIAGVSLAGAAPRVIQEVPIPPRVLCTATEMVDDPSNAGQKVSAQVKYTVRGKIVLAAGEDAPFLDGHRAQVRLDVKVAEIRSSDILESLPGAGSRTFEEMLRLVPGVQVGEAKGAEDVLSATSKALGDILGTQRVDPNVGAQAGGWTIREYGLDRLRVSAAYQVDREVSFGHGSPLSETLGGPIIDWGTLNRLNPVPRMERFVPDPKPGDVLDPETIEVLKNWGGGAITNQDGRLEGLGFLPIGKIEYPLRTSVSLPQYGRDSLAGLLNITGKPIVSSELLGSVNASSVQTLASSTTFSGEDMNSLRYAFQPNAFPNCTGIGDGYFPPGTMWVPDRPGYQVMSNYQPVSFRMTFSPFAEIDPTAFAQGEFRTHCLNMDLKEPEKGVKFYPYRLNDPVVAGLMDLTNNSRIRGPWDQARMWIYTNKAGIDAINDRLIPGVSGAQYLTSLKQIAQLGGLSDRDMADKKMFVPKLLAGRGMALSTLAWGFDALERRQPKELGAWLAGFPEEMGKLLAGDKADQEQLAQVLALALDSGSSDVRQGALKALLKKPQGHGALAGHVGPLARCLLSGNAGEAELALDAYALVGAEGKDALQHLAAHGANAKIKQKAAALAGG